MRLVLANPHYYIYGKMVVNVLLRRKHFLKYQYFLDYYVKDPTKKTAVFLDGTKTSLAAISIHFPFFPKFFTYIEFVCWMFLNGINPFKIRVYFDVDALDPKEDIIIDFARSLKLTEKDITGYPHFQGLVLFFLTHYFLKPETIREYFQEIPNVLLAAEHNLAQEEFFRTCFPGVKEVYQLPYAFEERFVNLVPFEERKNKALGLGTIAPIRKENKEFLEFFKTDVLQPMRKILFEKGKEYPQEIDVVIRQFENFTFLRDDSEEKSAFFRFLKRYAPSFVLKLMLNFRPTPYYKFDIVKKYNEYRMFISGEELVGLPPINAFEGMACGSAYIGIDHPMYRNLGLIPGVHYITYQEGDLDDLMRTIRYYQAHPKELTLIAQAGSEYVRTHFNRKMVAGIFWKDLEFLQKAFKNEDVVRFSSKFSKRPK